MSDQYVRERLEYLRGEIEAERISYFEIAELQDLAEYIDPTDVVLLEWAGVPEFPEARTAYKAGNNIAVRYCDTYDPTTNTCTHDHA